MPNQHEERQKKEEKKIKIASSEAQGCSGMEFDQLSTETDPKIALQAPRLSWSKHSGDGTWRWHHPRALCQDLARPGSPLAGLDEGILDKEQNNSLKSHVPAGTAPGTGCGWQAEAGI